MDFSNIKSVLDLLEHFKTDEDCIKHLEQLRWSEGKYCPRCFKDNPYCFNNSHQHKCSDPRCGKQFNVKTKSIFEASKISLRKWFLAIYLFSSHKKGISSLQLAKDLSITQKSAWFMLHRIREMYNDTLKEKLSGVIEADETFVGGKNKNRHADKKVKYSQGRSFKDKTPVLGLLDRVNKKVYTFVVKNTSRSEIRPIVRETVASGSTFYSDEWSAYRGLNDEYWHSVVDHSRKEYARGDIHTNTIEGFWSHLKRGIIGIYHYTSRKHLQAYCNEFSFRYNNRFLNPVSCFDQAIKGSFMKRVKYSKLIT